MSHPVPAPMAAFLPIPYPPQSSRILLRRPQAMNLSGSTARRSGAWRECWVGVRCFSSENTAGIGPSEGRTEGSGADDILSQSLEKRILELDLDGEAGVVPTVTDGDGDDDEYFLQWAFDEAEERRKRQERKELQRQDAAAADAAAAANARPNLVGSLEGLALALGLFFIATYIGTEGGILVPFDSIYEGSSVGRPVLINAEEVLRQDFLRDESSVFFWQDGEKE